MHRRRRIIALLVVLLAAPSLFWSVTMPFVGPHESGWPYLWLRELFFVVCLAAAALALWFRPPYWQLLLLLAVGIQAYANSWNFSKGIVATPSHWTYFSIVMREAAVRGIDGGPGLVWSLIVLPIALPVMLLTVIWICVATAFQRENGAI